MNPLSPKLAACSVSPSNARMHAVEDPCTQYRASRMCLLKCSTSCMCLHKSSTSCMCHVLGHWQKMAWPVSPSQLVHCYARTDRVSSNCNHLGKADQVGSEWPERACSVTCVFVRKMSHRLCGVIEAVLQDGDWGRLAGRYSKRCSFAIAHELSGKDPSIHACFNPAPHSVCKTCRTPKH